MKEDGRTFGAFLGNLAAQTLLRLPLALPFAKRIPTVGWLVDRLAGPIAGWHKRVRANLALIHPGMDRKEVSRLEHAVVNNAGRVLAELWSQQEFIDRVGDTPLVGPGLEALKAAQNAGRPIVGVTGHFGSYDAMRVALVRDGFDCAGLYKPAKNPYFNDAYAMRMEGLAGQVFPTTRRGLAQVSAHLRKGGFLAILVDQRDSGGAWLDFMGQPALTPLTAANLALKNDALFVPCFGIRQANGLDFELRVETPIELTDKMKMMQDFNDLLGEMVRKHPDQWLWSHRRWASADASEPQRS
ncbi:lysophospholipid acyltransferase family protein [Aliiroseovarius subalbicans]|uniref:lysophospholipid acyltransferase family protein n=1 Tax=Aliiroseovarius subalbicans TaxID=2925840 RepID=UPI001F55C38E|nr:lysophospholipid acyltransferase family protein [Aliiroseovarius subalbicans]MCI2398866.1 lysophospholipid acyltransferase family protein [Aliiroseovarius subalbicans]